MKECWAMNIEEETTYNTHQKIDTNVAARVWITLGSLLKMRRIHILNCIFCCFWRVYKCNVLKNVFFKFFLFHFCFMLFVRCWCVVGAEYDGECARVYISMFCFIYCLCVWNHSEKFFPLLHNLYVRNSCSFEETETNVCETIKIEKTSSSYSSHVILKTWQNKKSAP